MAESNLFSRQLDNGTWEYSVKNGDVFQPISPADYKYRSEAEDRSSMGAYGFGMKDRVMNAIDKAGLLTGDDMRKNNTAYPQLEREANQREHPVADTLGSITPYAAAVPLAIASGGSIPAAMAIGAGTGALLADEGDVAMDTAVGAAGPLVGGAVVKGAQKLISGARKIKAGTDAAVKAADADISDELLNAYNTGRGMRGEPIMTRAQLSKELEQQITKAADKQTMRKQGPFNWGVGGARIAPIGLLDQREEAWNRRMQ